MLATHFNINVNVAKQLLWSYKEARKDLSVVYYVSGFVGRCEQKVLLVKEKNLDYVLSKLTHTVSVHVYSVELDKNDSKKIESIHVPQEVKNIQRKGYGKTQALISKYFVPVKSVKSTMATSRNCLSWPKRQKMYQSTLWCPCEGTDGFGFFTKNIKRSSHLLDRDMDDKTLGSETHELALSRDNNEDKQMGGDIDSDSDMYLSGVLEFFESASRLQDQTNEGENKSDAAERIKPVGEIDMDSTDTFLSEAFEVIEGAHGSMDSTSNDKMDGHIVGRNKPVWENDLDSDDMYLSDVLEAIECANGAGDSDTKKKREAGGDDLGRSKSEGEIVFDSDDERFLIEAIERVEGDD